MSQFSYEDGVKIAGWQYCSELSEFRTKQPNFSCIFRYQRLGLLSSDYMFYPKASGPCFMFPKTQKKNKDCDWPVS